MIAGTNYSDDGTCAWTITTYSDKPKYQSKDKTGGWFLYDWNDAGHTMTMCKNRNVATVIRRIQRASKGYTTAYLADFPEKELRKFLKRLKAVESLSYTHS